MSLLADSPQHTYYYNNQGVGGGGVTLQEVLQLKIQHPLPLLGDKGKVGGGGWRDTCTQGAILGAEQI